MPINAVNGPRPSSAQILADPATHDFISELQGNDRSAHLPGTASGAQYDSLLETLQACQGRAVAGTSDEGTPSSVSTTA